MVSPSLFYPFLSNNPHDALARRMETVVPYQIRHCEKAQRLFEAIQGRLSRDTFFQCHDDGLDMKKSCIGYSP